VTAPAAQALFENLDDRTLAILERRRRTSITKRRGWLMRRALLTADLVGLATAFIVAQEVYLVRMHDPGALTPVGEFVTFALSLPLWVVGAKLYGLYDRDEEQTDYSTADDFTRLFHLITVCTFLLFCASRVTQWFRPEFSKLFVFWILAIGLIGILRAAARVFCRRQIHYLQNTVIVGAGDVGQSLARKLLKHPEYGLNLVGFIDSNPRERDEDLRYLTLLGDLDDLNDIVEFLDVERVIVAFTGDHHEQLRRNIAPLRAMDVRIDIVPRLFDNLNPSVSIHTVEGIPLLSLPPTRLSQSSLLIKRALDLTIAGVVALALSPVFLSAAIAVKLSSRGPIFYRHARIGRRGREFRLVKFRTMQLEMCRGEAYGGTRAEDAFAELMADPVRSAEFQTTYKLRDDPRVTRVGALLRRTSIDELPQLWNVLRGDISLVGPRALTGDELEQYYGDKTPLLLEIKPGITGYWQINGRSDLAYSDRVRLDLAYVGGWSVGLDLLILAKTLRVIVGRRGAV
jgi:exopolysaccharide biosynthesis polyprenyl glycosylphosphotransferase